jgi:hypothetical protein
MSFQERVRNWLGITTISARLADIPSRALLASIEAKNRDRHAELLRILRVLEMKMQIEHVGRKENVIPSDWDQVQAMELQKMLQNPPKKEEN